MVNTWKNSRLRQCPWLNNPVTKDLSPSLCRVTTATSAAFKHILRISIFFFLEDQIGQKQRMMCQKHGEGQLCLRHLLSMLPKELVSPSGPTSGCPGWGDTTSSLILTTHSQPCDQALFWGPIISSVPESPPLSHPRKERSCFENSLSPQTRCISLACFLQRIVSVSSNQKYFLSNYICFF